MTVPAHKQIENGNAGGFLKQYWFIIVAVVAMAGSWSEMRASGIANDKINSQQEAAIEALGSDLNELDRKYIEDVTYIKTTLNQMMGNGGSIDRQIETSIKGYEFELADQY